MLYADRNYAKNDQVPRLGVSPVAAAAAGATPCPQPGAPSPVPLPFLCRVQVLISYGQKSNAELLLLYGFVIDRNLFDQDRRPIPAVLLRPPQTSLHPLCSYARLRCAARAARAARLPG